MVSNPIGQVLKSYQIEALIGTGGFGAVYRARQAVVEREVAIKIIWPAFANHPNFIRRFEAEAQLVAGLEHPYIVPLYDYWRDPEGAYIVMRWIRGGTLRSHLARAPFGLPDIHRLVGQVGAALALAHRYGVVHRDIKPENILLDDEHNAYLADFGIAQILSSAQPDDEMMMGLGSPAYAAPEQVSGGLVSAQSDIYSFAIILYEMLTGEHPFPHLADMTMTEMNDYRNSAELPPASVLRPEMGKSVDKVLAKATSLDVNRRYTDALTFVHEFQKAINSGRQVLFDTPSSRVQQIIPNPYKGLRSFQETDAHHFFGREALVHRLVERLREQVPFHRFLAIVGPSGSGKSSLVKAGLMPSLRQGAVGGSSQWYYDEFVPGKTPFDELINTLMSIATHAREDELRALVERDNLGFYEALHQVLPDDDTELLLFIDQFEEVFTLSQGEAYTTRFLESLYTAVTRSQTRLRLVITIRADFYDRPLLQPFLSDLVRERTEVVVPLSPIELERVIIEPARKVGVTIDSGLVTAIVTEVKQQSGSLPLLQYALSELFELREGAFISAKAYAQLGGVRGALARRADELYQMLGAPQKNAVKQLFLRLITLGEGTEDTRRRVLLSEITSLSKNPQESAIFSQLVDQLGQARLLTFDRDPGTRSPTVEVTHEAIIREWALLRAWLDESRQDVRMQRALSVLTTEWASNGYDASFILRGARLEQFERWIEQTKLTLTQDEHAYIEASMRLRQQELDEERERVEREQALEQRSIQRLRWLVVVLAMASGIALFLSAFAFGESNRAETALATSDANALVSASLALEASARRALSEGDGDLALVLALEANEGLSAPPIQSRNTLAEVAFSSGTRAILRGHSASVQSVDIDGQSRFVASGSTDASVRLWDIDSGEVVHDLRGHSGDVTSVRFSPDGRYLASGAFDFTVIVWDVARGEMVHRLVGHDLPIQSLEFSGDGRQLITASSDGSLILWDVEGGTMLRRFEGHGASVLTAVISPEGDTMLSGARDGSMYLWDMNTGEIVRSFEGNQSGVNDVVYAPDGASVVSAAGDGSLIRWDVASGAILGRFAGSHGEVRAIAFNETGDHLYSVGVGGEVILWDTSLGLEIDRLHGHGDDVLDIAIVPNESIAATASKDQTIRLWNIGTPAVYGQLEGHTQRITGVGYIEATNTLVSTSTDRTLRLWDATTMRETARYSWDVFLLALDVHAPTSRALVGSREGWLKLVDLNTGEIALELVGHSDSVLAVAFAGDDEALSASQDGSVYRWDLNTGEVITRYEGHNGAVYGVQAVGADRVVSVDRDGKTLVWDKATGRILEAYEDHSQAIYALDVVEDTGDFATGSRDATVMVRDEANGVRRFLGDIGTIWAVDFSADRSRLVAGASDGVVLVWDTATNNVLQRLVREGIAVFDVEFVDEESLLLVGYDDGALLLWRSYAHDQLLDWARDNRYIRDLTCFERVQYRIEPYCVE